MKIKNKTNEHVKIRMEDGKVYDFPPGKVRTLKKELAEAIIEKAGETFNKVED